MKPTAILSAAFATVLLAGCAGTPSSSDVSPVSVAPAATSAATTEPSDQAPAAETQSSETAAETSAAAEPEKSKRGNLIKKAGDVAGVLNADGNPLVTFTVHSIKSNFKCTSQFSDKPENGTFLALDVSVETKTGVKDVYFSDWQMSPFSFKTIAPNGTTSNADLGTMAAYSCVDDSKVLPEVGDNEKARGLIILDVENPEGILVFQDSMTNAAWEWEYPAK